MKWTVTKIAYSYANTLSKAINHAAKLYPDNLTRVFKAKDGSYHVWCDRLGERTVLTTKVDAAERTYNPQKFYTERTKTCWFIEGTWYRPVKGEGKWWNYDVQWHDNIGNIWQ